MVVVIERTEAHYNVRRVWQGLREDGRFVRGYTQIGVE